jgi:ABC-type transport system involved in multi-copper enzyme maturation permease subunit
MRRRLSLSTSSEAWRTRLVLGSLAIGACLAYAWADVLPRAAQYFFLGAFLMMLIVLWLRGWFTIVGPTFLYDLVRMTRRNRFTLYRLYAYFAFAILALFYAGWLAQDRQGDFVSNRIVALFGQAFFYTFMSLQILAVLLLTPGYVADVLTDKKERRTLDFLLATDLDNREIILSKLAGRLANLLLMLLTGLPIVSLMELMGGVQPELVIVGFGVAGITAVGVAAVSLLHSVYSRKTRTAIVLTYLLIATYLILSTSTVVMNFPTLAGMFLNIGPVLITGTDLVDAFNAGNPVLQMIYLVRDVGLGGRLGDSLLFRLRNYALFHGLLTAVCVTWAVLRLRAVFLRQAEGKPAGGKRRGSWTFRPSVGAWPMLWKEIFIEGRLRFGWLGKLVVVSAVVGSFLLLLVFFDRFDPNRAPGNTPYMVSFWSVFTGGLVACLLLLAVGVRSANAMSAERDRVTLDGLLTTPLGCSEILFGKLAGSILGVRWGLLWLTVIWGLGIGAGILHNLLLPLWLLAWTIAAALLALLGLWFSLVSASGARAMMYTLLCAVVWGVTPLVPFHYFFIKDEAFHPWLRSLYKLQLGLSPPATLGVLLPFWRSDVTRPSPGGPTGDPWIKDRWQLGAAFLGIALWALAAILLWCLTNYRFKRMTGRRGLPAARKEAVK